jgi:ketosteroid isomerase-like protein
MLPAGLGGGSAAEGDAMSVARNIEIVRRFYAAGPADDDRDRLTFFAPDAVWHVPGDNPVAGPYRGAATIATEMPRRMAPLDRWDIDVREVMGNDDLVVATVHVSGRRRGIAIETDGAHVFRLNDAGQVVEAWGFTEDQAGLDAFFRA